MGLSVCVGALVDALEYDEEGAEFLRRDFALIAEEMAYMGLTPHAEPEFCEVWSADAMGYGGLHALCEVLGYAQAGQEVPRDKLLDGRETPMADAVMAEIWNLMEAGGGEAVPFAHLLLHSDSEGFYLPQDFDPPFFPVDPEGGEREISVGSAARLAMEVAALGGLLEIPDEMTVESEALMEALAAPRADGSLWQAQPIAAHTCVLLRDACALSMETGAAITFQ
ncbi:hypothetical protein IV417_17850 [Alphaproteobacteria bacterium KMM 3653]|uniref:Uncharacterized protein n=1 Tax=Harenicola maris TaxID=2841044 RepID=A0AAP2CVF4_9RHOB|nr:hypothetical protein [Harenicola maris]